MILRDKIPDGSKLFHPWMLGSQPCEQTFRAARSMTSTFSTQINFSIYALLQRLHRLQIQSQLESEMEETGICYPRVLTHVKKVGFPDSKVLDTTNLLHITNKDITDMIQCAKDEAIVAVTELGMSVKGGKWEEMVLKPVATNDDDDDEDNDEGCAINDGDNKKTTSEQVSDDLEFSHNERLEDISSMQKVGLVEDEVFEKLQSRKMKQTSSSTISIYSAEVMDGEKEQPKKHSEFVQVSHNGKTVFIRKSTAIWLFQEYERVSSDRLFRVRTKQPNSSESHANVPKASDANHLPARCETINVGDVCVFQNTSSSKWKLGKVLRFFYHNGKNSKGQQCKLSSLHVNNNKQNVSVVCSLFFWHAPLSIRTFVLSPDHEVTASYTFRLDTYKFTLMEGCFEVLQAERKLDSHLHSVMMQNTAQVDLACAKYFTLSWGSAQFLEDNLKSDTTNTDDAVYLRDPSSRPNVWKKYGCYVLTTMHKAHLVRGNLLDDIHMGAAQALLKEQFPDIGGFRNTLLQYSDSVEPINNSQILQVIHVRLGHTDHWIVMSTVGCGESEVDLYDSLQCSPSVETQTVIAKYIRSQSKSVKIKVINVATQKGNTDCGLYAVAMMTSIAYKEDPVNVVYSQADLRIHLQQCFEKGFLEKFPISKKRRLNRRITKEVVCDIYCTCRLPEPDDGSEMIQCDRCNEWYHVKCVDLDLKLTDDDWFCAKCL